MTLGTVINKDDAVYEWAKTNPFLADRLLFDYLEGNKGSCSISPVPGDSVVANYIDGSKKCQYTFALQIIMPVSDTTDAINIENMFKLRTWQDWIDRQEKFQNYPDFGPLCGEFELENLNNMPSLAMRYENGLAKYQFFARINYIEREE